MNPASVLKRTPALRLFLRPLTSSPTPPPPRDTTTTTTPTAPPTLASLSLFHGSSGALQTITSVSPSGTVVNDVAMEGPVLVSRRGAWLWDVPAYGSRGPSSLIAKRDANVDFFHGWTTDCLSILTVLDEGTGKLAYFCFFSTFYLLFRNSKQTLFTVVRASTLTRHRLGECSDGAQLQ